MKEDYNWFAKNHDWLHDVYGDCYLAISQQQVVGVYNLMVDAWRDLDAKNIFDSTIVQWCGKDFKDEVY